MKDSYFWHSIPLLLLTVGIVGCASTQTTKSSQTLETVVQNDAQPSPSARKTAADIAPILEHVTATTTLDAPPVIDSGTDDDGVWVEGSGIFTGSLDDVYSDLVDPLVIGPVHMTKDIAISDFASSNTRTTYVMHVKMRYILSVEFDLTALIEPFYDDIGNQIGWTYTSEKLSGSRFLTKVTTRLIVRKHGDNAFQVDFKSENVATMNKEAEARKHLETLFDYWKNKSLERQ